jgi:hypothetical protein
MKKEKGGRKERIKQKKGEKRGTQRGRETGEKQEKENIVN